MCEVELGLRLPEEATLTDFADGLAVVLVTKHPENVKPFMPGMVKLNLAQEKHRDPHYKSQEKYLKSIINYLRVMIDAI